MKLAMNSDRKKMPDLFDFRPMTLNEIQALRYGQHVNVILNSGRVGQVKINGEVKRWKRDPDRLEVPVKYGMYECARFSTAEALRRFVVAIVSAEEKLKATEAHAAGAL